MDRAREVLSSKGVRVYLAGPITGDRWYRMRFWLLRVRLWFLGIKRGVMNPAKMELGFSHEEYLRVCYMMVSVCDVVVLLPGWRGSTGACMEVGYASRNSKVVVEYLSGSFRVVDNASDYCSCYEDTLV